MDEEKLGMGKIPARIFEKDILPFLGYSDPKVVYGPKMGFDSCVIEYFDKYMIVSTDPCLGVPIEFFGYFLVHFTASDVALFGAKPKWMLYTLLLPPQISRSILREITTQVHKECISLEIAVIGGHTGIYPSINVPIASSTIIGFVDKDKLVTPGDAQPGDKILVTKGIGIETAASISYAREGDLRNILSEDEILNLKQEVFKESCVLDASILSDIGVHAMHDATEGGISTCLPEMAKNSNLGFIVYEEKLLIPSLISKVLDFFGIQPLATSSTGTLIAAIPQEKVKEARKRLRENKIESAVIGEFIEDPSENVLLTKEGIKKKFPSYAEDPYAKLFYEETR